MSSEVEVAGVQFPPGIYHIAVASHGRFTHERLTDREYVTITPPSARPDPRQLWKVYNGRKHGTIIIQRPGSIRPPLSLTYKSEHGHPKEGDKVMVRRDEFPTDWELDPVRAVKGHFYIRVPRFHLAGAQSVIPSRTLGIAVAPERINPPFLEIDHEDQLQWVFERVSHHSLEEES